MTKDIPDACLELAVLYERRHRVEEAYALIGHCLRTDPGYVEAQLFKARLLRRRKDDAASEALFRELAANEQALPQVRAQAWAEIAAKHDRQEEYEPAMQAMLKCKEILIQLETRMRKEADTVLADLRDLAESLTPEHFRRWSEAGNAPGGQI